MIFSPSAAVADAEPKISHPMWAAAVGAAALAENRGPKTSLCLHPTISVTYPLRPA